MRTFYAEMKKSISEALEKRRLKQQTLEKVPSSSQEDEEQKEESFMIDTSSQLPSPSDVKLDRTISQQDHEKLEKDIEQITHKIIEKSELLISLATPECWLPSSNHQNQSSAI
jgi:hypothetical protein